jgi:hypothetical protein
VLPKENEWNDVEAGIIDAWNEYHKVGQPFSPKFMAEVPSVV